jgi:hypothetical protein
MSLETRVLRLENLIGVGNDEVTAPLVIITVSDQSKNSTDQPIPTISIIPGQPGKFKGTTLFRDKDEAPTDFLRRSEKKHAEFYATL